MPGNVLLDTNLLVLLVVGSTSIDFISKHKRTDAYSKDAFELLSLQLAKFDVILTTPHILAETSNLCRNFANPGKDQISTVFQALIQASTELSVDSQDASVRNEYIRLGLTDAAILAVQEQEVVLFTDDLDLYVASTMAGKMAINFSHLRDDYGI